VKSASWSNNERDYGDYFDFTGTMVESYYYNILFFPMGWYAKFYNYLIYTSNGIIKLPQLNRYTYGAIHESILNDETLITSSCRISEIAVNYRMH